jgi:hypothetical protein
MIVREPAVAGMFYQADAKRCRREVEGLFAQAVGGLKDPGSPALPERIVGGVVPHAGYVYSGEVAARTLEAIAARGAPAVFVVFGAMHRSRSRDGLLFDRGSWQTPLGPAAVDESLATRLLDCCKLLRPDADAHEQEHSIEVQLPLIRFRFPDARIVPILVPPAACAAEIGRAVGLTIAAAGAAAVVLGSTDLTHYGPRYGFTPMGVGLKALQWAKEVNDAGVLDAVRALAAEKVVAETAAKFSACGGGAVAATLAAARALGATRGVVLEHTTSYEVISRTYYESPSDAVGYLAAVLG